MAGIRSRIRRVVAAHRRAAATAGATGAAPDPPVPKPRSAAEERGRRELAHRLRVTAEMLAPGWLREPLDAVPAGTPLGATGRPELVRIGVSGYPVAAAPAGGNNGVAQPLDDARFPVVVPLGHIVFDSDARDPLVAGVLQATLLRLLAATTSGGLLVRGVDPAGLVFGPFAPLREAGVMPPPVTDRAGLRAVLTDAERWVRANRRDRYGGPPESAGRRRRPASPPILLLVVACWPQHTEADDLSRIAALALDGPAAGLHLLVAGWPPAVRDATARQSLPAATQVRPRYPYALVEHPSGGPYDLPVPAPAPVGRPPTAPRQKPAESVTPVVLDEAPPGRLIAEVCRGLAARALDRARVGIGELLPDGPLWAGDAAGGLQTVVGQAGDTPVRLRLCDATPHWLVGGRSGSGRTALLLGVLYGLCVRYPPAQLAVYLIDFSGTASSADLTGLGHEQPGLPHVRAVVVGDRDLGAAVLRELSAELAARKAAFHATAVSGFAGAPGVGVRLPRLLCMIEEPAAGLVAEPGSLVEQLARDGGAYGIHLVVAGCTPPPSRVASQFRVRIALPGGSEVLDPANHAAAGLVPGTAVVNTAGGLGGPAGATRAHEQLVGFPDPHADPAELAGLRDRLLRAGGGR